MRGLGFGTGGGRQGRASSVRSPLLALAGLAIAAPLLAGCDEPQAATRRGISAEAASAPSIEALATAAVEEKLRERVGEAEEMRQRAIQVYRQARGDSIAVCGQVNRTGSSSHPFLPYVGIVEHGGAEITEVQLHLAATPTEATRVYFAMVEHCFEGGGPPAGRPRLASLPPAPQEGALDLGPTVAEVARPTPQVVAMPSAPELQPLGAITTTARHGVNVRAAPGGGAEVLFVLPRASTVQVFGEAPGGWLQIGGQAPLGWLHVSMVARD